MIKSISSSFSNSCQQLFGENSAGNMKKDVGSENWTEISSYWGVAPKVHLKEDGTPWKWTCFTPHETYYADVKIDLEKHHPRRTISDSIAYWGVKSLRIPTDLFFQRIISSRRGTDCGSLFSKQEMELSLKGFQNAEKHRLSTLLRALKAPEDLGSPAIPRVLWPCDIGQCGGSSFMALASSRWRWFKNERGEESSYMNS